jgi:hypothetical protein
MRVQAAGQQQFFTPAEQPVSPARIVRQPRELRVGKEGAQVLTGHMLSRWSGQLEAVSIARRQPYTQDGGVRSRAEAVYLLAEIVGGLVTRNPAFSRSAKAGASASFFIAKTTWSSI